MHEFHLNILTPLQLRSRNEAQVVLDLLCSISPDLTPERWGTYEPLRAVFDPSKPEELLDSWDIMVFWKRRRPRAEGSIGVGDDRAGLHGWLSASVEASKADVDGLVRFVQQASSGLRADFACLHLMTKSDLSVARATRTGGLADPARERYSLMVTTHQLRKYLPDLYWGTVFGPAYIAHFGRERILSTPVPVIEKLEGGLLYLQLSDSPFDLETDFARVDAVRQQAKRHLNKNSFYDPAAPPGHVYDVPAFHIEDAGIANLAGEQTGHHAWPDWVTGQSEFINEDASGPNAQEVATALAQDAVRLAEEQFGLDLDFSRESVGKVEQTLAALFKGGDKGRSGQTASKAANEDLVNIAAVWGSYIGEVLRLHCGGHWYWARGVGPDRALALALRIGETSAFPVAKAWKRLTQGPEDDVWFYFQVIVAKLE